MGSGQKASLPSPGEREGTKPPAVGDDPARLRRVAMIIQRFRPHFTGQGIQLEKLCATLGRSGVISTIITAVTGEHLPHEEVAGYRIRRLRCDIRRWPWTRRSTRFWMPMFALRVFVYLWRHRDAIELVHVHGMTDGLYGAWLFGRLSGVPIVFEMTLLGVDDPEAVRRSGNLFRRLRYAIYRRCDGFVAMSPALAEPYRRAGLPEDRLHIIPQGVDNSRFSPLYSSEKAATLRRSLGLTPRAPALAFVGSLVHRKGIDVLMRAWAEIQSEVPAAQLVLVGESRFADDPVRRAFFADQVDDLPDHAVTNLHTLGIREDPERILRAADVFLFPSRREGFGAVIIEAMACGLPCVVADLPGITDFIFSHAAGIDELLAGTTTAKQQTGDDPEPQGVVIEQEDPGSLARAVIYLLRNPEAAGRIGAAARMRVEEAFGFDRIASMYLDCYANHLENTGNQ